MRCLNCHEDDIPITTEICPCCKAYLPGLLHDVLPQGTLLNNGLYQLDYALGRGGFGITYRAVHTKLEQPVAIKEFYPQEHAVRDGTSGQVSVAPAQQEPYQRGVERFMREGKILARLKHGNVVTVQNLFEERGTAYLVMELVTGTTLRQLLDKQKDKCLPEAQVQALFEQLIEALDAVHKSGVYHLDLKPENVLITEEGQIRLIDFGAARQGFRSSRSQAFSPPYAAPEVFSGHDIGPESDIFELGMMLHEMLTGHLPPSAVSRLFDDTWELSDIEAPWQNVIMAALPLRREDRPDNVRELLKIFTTTRQKLEASRLLSGTIRCLHCDTDDIPVEAQICPNCKVHLPSLLRDVLAPGTLLHRNTYQIDYALGRGGFGVTYRAVNTTLEQWVAIKEFYPQEHAMREGTTGRLTVASSQQESYRRGLQRFIKEGRILAKLNHPHVVRVLYLFEERATAYLVMELVSGRTLRTLLDEHPGQPLPEAHVRTIMVQLVDALTAVHKAGVLHLDLKPENILLTPDEQVIVVDFGAARLGFHSHTTRAYTLEYAPPELLAEKELGPETDIFELGVILHELLTGERPAPVLNRIIKETWSADKLPEPWQNLLKAALALRREDRPKDVKGWWNSIPSLIEEPQSGSIELGDKSTKSEPEKIQESVQVGLPEVKCPQCHHLNRPGIKFCERCAAPLVEEKITCLHCGHTNRPGVKFCENCATSLAKCPKCHHLNRPGIKFCENCGHNLTRTPYKE